MNQLIWYPSGDPEKRRAFLSQLCKLRDEGKITLWMDQDESGWFYDAREIEPEFEDGNNNRC